MSAPASDWLRHIRLLLWNHWMEFNETWKEARSKRPPPRLCFSGRLEKQDSHPGLWLAEAFSTSPLKPLNGIQQNLTGRKISTSSNKFVFFKSIGGTRWPPGLSFAETFSTSPPWPLNKIQRNLTGSKISMSSTNFVLFGPIKKAALASDWLRHFRLLLCDRWTEFNETWQETKFQRRPLPSSCYSTKLDWKHDINVLYKVCVFRADRKNKMAAPDSDWLRHFRLLFWIEFNKSWPEIRYMCMSTPSFKFVIFGPIGKTTICGPWASYLCIK